MNPQEEIALLSEVPVDIEIELDRKVMTAREVLQLEEGSVIGTARSARSVVRFMQLAAGDEILDDKSDTCEERYRNAGDGGAAERLFAPVQNKSGAFGNQRNTREAADSGNAGAAEAAMRAATVKLEKAVSKGVIHKNQAANRKSAIAKRAEQLKSA